MLPPPRPSPGPFVDAHTALLHWWLRRIADPLWARTVPPLAAGIEDGLRAGAGVGVPVGRRHLVPSFAHARCQSPHRRVAARSARNKRRAPQAYVLEGTILRVDSQIISIGVVKLSPSIDFTAIAVPYPPQKFELTLGDEAG